jgi:hypothetical protein
MESPDYWVDQQYVANEAASILERLAEDPGLEEHQIIQASLTMLREMILNHYGLLKDTLVATDVDDFVEFVVNEANE